MPSQSPYAFRQILLRVHEPGRRDPALIPAPGEWAPAADPLIVVPGDAGPTLRRAALDLQEYMKVSMGVSMEVKPAADPAAALSGCRGHICLTVAGHRNADLADGGAPRGFRIDCGEHIVVTGYDEAGAMQGGFYVEDVMNLRRAPFFPRGTAAKRPLFSPRMVHSGYGLDEYPDEYIARIAHAGMDALLVFVSGADETPTGPRDFNGLCRRAAVYGVDVYAYSYLKSEIHPGEDGAAAYYDRVYGEVFKKCPAFKGVVLVGESVEFPSRDERTTGKSYLTPPEDGLPPEKPSPGWWPCRDFPQWLALVRDTVRRYRPDADIVFWTYNWGYAPEADRLALIGALPADISLLVTFEMFENRRVGPVTVSCVDYTLSFEGPGEYFLSEARAAAARGIRLYAMANTGGLTWDIGVIPYEPAPGQWIRRHRALLEARRRYGLCGLMESHHFGFWPSFVSELAKASFTAGSPPPEETLSRLAVRDFGEAQAPRILKAWSLWSEGIRRYIPTNEDQYGPFRIGPAYPLTLFREVSIPETPGALWGARICQTLYSPADQGRFSPLSFRLPVEISSLSAMEALFREGAMIVGEAAEALDGSRAEDARRMAGLGLFIALCAHTAVNVKKWYRLKLRLLSAERNEDARELVASMTAVARDELENTRAAIPLVQADSRLGWEPSMEYLGDEAHLRWKLRQVEGMLAGELARYADSLRFNA